MRVIRLLAIVVALVGLTLVTRPYVHGLSFVIRAAGMQGMARRLAELDSVAVLERDIAIEIPRGSIRGRVYEPVRRGPRTALLIPGIHPSGIDEPSLVRLARQFASSGVTVVTPDIPELARFELPPGLADTIEQAAAWLADDGELTPTRRIGLFGLGFSGGLSIVAAGRPSLVDRVSHVFSLGGHDDLQRVLRYVCTGQEQFPPGQARIALDASGAARSGGTGGAGSHDQVTRVPHEYGAALLLLGTADRVVPSAQAEALREAVRQYLLASARNGSADRTLESEEVGALNARIVKMPEPTRTLMRYMVSRDVVHLGARLLPYVNGFASAPSLSVSKSPKPRVPVFLLHGVDDNLVPSIESEYLAQDLRGHAPVRLLQSALIPFESDRSVEIGAMLQLAGFFGDLLSR